MYVRKTEDEYEIQGDYGFGFETVTTEVTRRDVKKQIRLYRENEPGVDFKIRKRRVPITS